MADSKEFSIHDITDLGPAPYPRPYVSHEEFMEKVSEVERSLDENIKRVLKDYAYMELVPKWLPECMIPFITGIDTMWTNTGDGVAVIYWNMFGLKVSVRYSLLERKSDIPIRVTGRVWWKRKSDYKLEGLVLALYRIMGLRSPYRH